MKFRTHSALVLGGLVCATGAMAGEIAPDLSARLEHAGPDEPIRIIVHLTSRADMSLYRGNRRKIVEALQRHAQNTQAPLRAALAAAGVSEATPLWIINGMAAEVPARLIPSLARRPDVAGVRLDAQASLPPTDITQAPATWNLSAIHADGMWAQGLTGNGAVVATLDTGADPDHPDLKAKWRGGNNSWYDPYGQHATPYDAHGHGTQIMGIMVGGAAGGVAIGVAPEAQWIAARIFNDAHAAYMSAIHRAFQWTLDPDGNPATDDAPHVVVGAWAILTANTCDTEFQPDVQTLKAADIAVAFAAGNSGPDAGTSLSPANYADSYAIGAVDETLQIAGFSARGPSACNGGYYPHVVAPGVNIRTADLSFGGVVPDPFVTVSGTSFSAAHMGGAIALLRAANTQADVAQVEAALNDSAADLGTMGADNTYGFGLVDIAAAHEHLAQAAPPPTEPPPPVVSDADADADGYTLEDGDCDDSEASIHPGATEVESDGIDQDCNGYDLTIAVARAIYTARRTTLEVSAASALGAQAGLIVQGVGAMTWNSASNTWELNTRVTSNPGTVTVSGPEGAVTAHVTLR